MSFINKLTTYLVVGLFALGMVAVPVALAQESGGSGLQLTPTRTDITANAGETKSFTITLKNVTGNTVTAQAFLNDFTSDGVSGSPKILTDENAEPSPFTLRNMLTGLEDIPLKAGETKEVKLTLNIEADVSPGAYFGAIRYAAVPEGNEISGDQKVSLTASVAHLVFLQIPGDVTQQIELQSLEARASGQATSFWQKPTDSTLSVKNLGNGFAQPFGKVTLSYNGKQVFDYEVNNTDPKGYVLPQSTREFTDSLQGHVNKPGKYTLAAGVAYGNGGEVVQLSSTFWYLPLWFIISIVVVILLLVALGYYLYRRASGPKK